MSVLLVLLLRCVYIGILLIHRQFDVQLTLAHARNKLHVQELFKRAVKSACAGNYIMHACTVDNMQMGMAANWDTFQKHL